MKDMIQDLLSRDAYPERTEDVGFVQTHISSVFILDEFVYKIKKPVNFGFLDFTTLKKRKHFCTREVELNSRVSEGVYLGVYPITFDGERYRIGGDGEVVDYAVKMRRLPNEALMKVHFENGTLKMDDIERVAKAIADFHTRAEHSEEIAKFGSIETVKFNTNENFQQTEKYLDISIPREEFNDLKKWTTDFYAANRALFEKRIEAGKIKDCHGDLHMEHVCLTDPIIIFDCIEFNERFRYSDTAADIAFLLMDLDFSGGYSFSEHLLETYLGYSGEEGINDLVNFYKVYRSYVRGKVTSFQLDDPNIEEMEKEKAKAKAKNYFSLAHSYIKENG